MYNRKGEDLIHRIFTFLLSLPGFEPGAFRLGGEPSILLRYRDIFVLFLFYLSFTHLSKNRMK